MKLDEKPQKDNEWAWETDTVMQPEKTHSEKWEGESKAAEKWSVTNFRYFESYK